MPHDYESSLFRRAVDFAVGVLIPKGSCSHTRWLVFDVEQVAEEGESLRYLLQYRAYSNYIDWRVVIPGNPHVRRNRESDWRDLQLLSGIALSNLARVAGIKASRLNVMLAPQALRNRILAKADSPPDVFDLEVAPGFVIASGCHDSEWRTHATETRGNPVVGTELTQHFEHRAQTIKVHSIKVAGPTGGTWGSKDGAWDAFTDGEWVNPDPDNLTGVWALYAGAGVLSATTTGNPDALRVDFNTVIQYYRRHDLTKELVSKADRWGRVKTSEKRAHVGFQFDADGTVIATGKNLTETGSVRFEWAEAEEPFILDRETHLRLCGVSEAKIRGDLADIINIWGDCVR